MPHSSRATISSPINRADISLQPAGDKRFCHSLHEYVRGRIDGSFQRLLLEDDYYQCISQKTASLFSASAKMGGLIAGASKEDVTRFENYGMNLGLGYQVWTTWKNSWALIKENRPRRLLLHFQKSAAVNMREMPPDRCALRLSMITALRPRKFLANPREKRICWLAWRVSSMR